MEKDNPFLNNRISGLKVVSTGEIQSPLEGIVTHTLISTSNVNSTEISMVSGDIAEVSKRKFPVKEASMVGNRLDMEDYKEGVNMEEEEEEMEANKLVVNESMQAFSVNTLEQLVAERERIEKSRGERGGGKGRGGIYQVRQLKDICRNFHLPCHGNKDSLINRLLNHIDNIKTA